MFFYRLFGFYFWGGRFDFAYIFLDFYLICIFSDFGLFTISYHYTNTMNTISYVYVSISVIVFE